MPPVVCCCDNMPGLHAYCPANGCELQVFAPTPDEVLAQEQCTHDDTHDGVCDVCGKVTDAQACLDANAMQE